MGPGFADSFIYTPGLLSPTRWTFVTAFMHSCAQNHLTMAPVCTESVCSGILKGERLSDFASSAAHAWTVLTVSYEIHGCGAQ